MDNTPDETNLTLDVRKLTKKLVKYNTTSSKSNIKLVEYLQSLLVGLGFDVTIQKHPYSVNKANIIARAGPRDVEQFMFSGHTDTVPVGVQHLWKSKPLVLTEDKEKPGLLFGRGSVDMKGSIAAMICAIAPLLPRAKEFKRELILGFTYDEEVGLLGAKHLVKSGLIKPRYALVGEPTLMRPVRMHKGNIYLRAECRGVSGHASNPKSGISAIDIGSQVLERLQKFAKDLETQTNEEYDVPFATLNVGMIKGGTKTNVIAENCVIEFNVRPIYGQKWKSIVSDLDTLLREIGEHDNQPLVSLHLTRRPTEPVTTDVDSLIVKVAKEVTGSSAGGASYSTDASILQLMGTECIILGPGDIAQAHKPNEFVAAAQLEAAVIVFRKIAEKMCLNTQ